MSYIGTEYYLTTYQGETITDSEELEYWLEQASMHIDTLTFNRIVKRGFDNLTEFQQEIISKVICMLAEFEYENEDLLESTLSSYSINGVSMSFDQSWNIEIQNGVAIPRSYYALLAQTGLTCKNLRY